MPGGPQRIVIVQASVLDGALALGLEPVGSTFWGGADGIQSYLQDQLPADFTVVGNDDEPDIEAIAALKPDLIIGNEAVEENLDMLQDIAPVAAYQSVDEDGRADWREDLGAIAEFTGTQDAADSVIQTFDDEVAEVDASITTSGESVMALRVRPDQVRHYLPESFVSGQVLQNLKNIELPGSAIASENGDWSVIPAEQLTVLVADHLIVFADSPEAVAALEQQTLWQQLPAVQNDNVCVVEDQVPWILSGPTAASLVAQDVRTCLGS